MSDEHDEAARGMTDEDLAGAFMTIDGALRDAHIMPGDWAGNARTQLARVASEVQRLRAVAAAAEARGASAERERTRPPGAAYVEAWREGDYWYWCAENGTARKHGKHRGDEHHAIAQGLATLPDPPDGVWRVWVARAEGGTRGE